MSSYVPLFLAFARREGYSCEISEPQLVCGSATPPPNRRYPGLVCYMVTITVNGVEYHGYGPSAGTARRYAAFEAYKALNPGPTKEATFLTSSVQNDGLKIESEFEITESSSDSACSENSTHHVTAEENDGNSYHKREHRDKGLIKEDKLRPVEDRVAPFISDNPVGQLQEVFMKEFRTLPTFAESVQVNGKATQFVCFVKMEDLSARGIGQSKKLAKRHAAENLLSLMITNGININQPSKKQKARNSSCQSRERDSRCLPKGLPSSSPARPRNDKELPLLQPSLLPLPLSPCPYPHTSAVPYGSSPSDSDDDNTVNFNIASSGLCEVVPTSNAKKALSPSTSKPTAPDQDALSDGSMPAQQISVPCASSGTSSVDVSRSLTFSEISSPFSSHSDPFQFTVRLPRAMAEPWSCAVDFGGSKQTPWEEIRRNSDNMTTPSTDYIYHGLKQTKHKPPLVKVERPADNCESQPVNVVEDPVHFSSLPVHPLFLSAQEDEQPSHMTADLARVQDDNIIKDTPPTSHDDHHNVVLTNRISVGLPSEGSVSAMVI